MSLIAKKRPGGFVYYATLWKRGWRFGGPNCRLVNPIVILRRTSSHKWGMFLIGYFSYVLDAFDFFSVSLTLTHIRDALNNYEKVNRPLSDYTYAIMITLMIRFVGAMFFGAIGDRYGRRWPLIFSIFAIGICSLGTGLVKTFTEFLICRALFGIFMGGLAGVSTATAIEDLDSEEVGIFSGIYLEGFSVGNLLAAIMNLALTANTKAGWRTIYFFGAGMSCIIALLRYMLPETDKYLESVKDNVRNDSISAEVKRALATGYEAVKKYWLRFIYMTLVFAGLNFCSHGTSDFYPPFLEDVFGSEKIALNTAIMSVGQIGAIVGGMVWGYFSTYLGRRLTLIILMVVASILLPAYTLLKNYGIIAGAFICLFFGLGVGGVGPVYLMEMSPKGYEAFFMGTTFQFGNLLAAASSVIESTLAEKFPLPPSKCPDPTKVCYDNAKIILIYCLGAFVFTAIVAFIGIENRGFVMINEVREDLDLPLDPAYRELFEENFSKRSQENLKEQ